MQLETATLCGAGPGERRLEQINQRDAYRDRNRDFPASSSAAAWPKRL